MVLALDPSSAIVGWAFLELPGSLIEGGLIYPSRQRAAAIDRIREMANDVRELLNTLDPADIVIEITSGKVGLHRHGGRGAGLGVYGMGVGAVWQACERWALDEGARVFRVPEPARVHPIPENAWTRRVPKAQRIAAVASEFPAYNPSLDPGGDLADAIGLGCWFLREHQEFPSSFCEGVAS